MDERGCPLLRLADKIGRFLDFAGKEERILRLKWTGGEEDTTRMDRDKNHSIRLWYDFGQTQLANWRGTTVSARVVERKVAAHTPKMCLLNRWSNKPACQLIRQLSLLQLCRHPNIVQFLGAVPNYNSKSLVIVTEHLPNGTLHELLHSKKFRIQQKDAVEYALDIARGMNYLHQHRMPVVHGELNPMNLLIDAAGHLKVSGIGLSKLIGCIWSEDGSDYATIQTLMYLHADDSFDFSRYLAPEFQKCKGNVDTSADVYSFGVIFQEMLESSNFAGRHAKVVAANVCGTDTFMVKTKLPPRLREVLAGCCDLDPEKRPQFRDIISSLDEINETMKKSRSVLKPLRSFVTNLSFRRRSLRTETKNQPGSSDISVVDPSRPHQSSPEDSIPPRAEEAEAKTGLPPKNAEEKLVGQCVVCWDAPAEAACVPCGHLSGCMNCLRDIKSNETGCPVCRAIIHQVVKVYVV